MKFAIFFIAATIVCISAEEDEQSCRKLCGSCPRLDASDCKDNWGEEFCRRYIGSYECENSNVKYECTKTCGKCPKPECKDRFSDCSHIRHNGDCEKKPVLAKKYCKKTCLLCD
ncbi:hypothetical protein Tcan_14077 [Toxocara canis]|uniref:ShKT domain-containing protein n=1 Tax=Toxocara canis TaxID=6265 RepID=A0A0B2V5M4_TOXCA|nr:hypothetical protein Tcan_14077 [Toxocara canis]